MKHLSVSIHSLDFNNINTILLQRSFIKMTTKATQAEWQRPSTRPEVIDQLVDGVDRYNPANVNVLEDYLYHQIREREYDCLANLAILKL